MRIAIAGAAGLVAGVLVAIWMYGYFANLDQNVRIHWLAAAVYDLSGALGVAALLGAATAALVGGVTFIFIRRRDA